MNAEGKPAFNASEVRQFALDYWNITATTKPLPSERDQNLRLTTDAGDDFLLKISNSNEDPLVLEFQDQAMTHIARDADKHFDGAVVCPQIQPVQTGERFVTVSGSANHTHSVRLLNYLPGVPLAHVTPHTKPLLASLGQLMANVDSSLRTFSHPGRNDNLQWDLKHASRVVRSHLAAVADHNRRKLVERFLEQFEQTAQPQFPRLQTSFIHNDANDLNVLVTTENRKAEVSGIIDFGDMVQSHTVFEPAIAAAYALLGKENPLDAALHVVEGYAAKFHLTELEIYLMFSLITTRLITSVVLAAHQRALEPDNEYLSVSENPAWTALEQLATIEPGYARERFRLAWLRLQQPEQLH